MKIITILHSTTFYGGGWGAGVGGLVRGLWKLLEGWLEDCLVWLFPNAFHIYSSSLCRQYMVGAGKFVQTIGTWILTCLAL